MTKQELIENIGEELYEKLSQEDREFMLATAGSLDVGIVDLDKLELTI